MAEPTVTQALHALGPNDDRGFAALARTIGARSGADVKELVAVFHGRDPAEAKKAAAVLQELGAVAFPALVESVKRDDAVQAVFDAQVLADVVTSARARLVAVLDPMLEDKRDHPMPHFKGLEEQHAPRRVCDEAYLIERELLATGESEDARTANQRAFLMLSNEKKDAEILKARRTRTFTDFAAGDGE